MNKYSKLLLLLPLLLVLSACGGLSEPITPESTGLWNQVLKLFSRIIIWLSGLSGGSFALGIIIFTVIIRLVLYPLTKQSTNSMAKMQEIQPEIEKINQKYKSKDDKESKQKKSQETMALYQKHGVNPFVGCLPILIQMPLFFALYQSIYRLLIGSTNSNPENGITGLEAYGAVDINTIVFAGTSVEINLAYPFALFGVIAGILMYFNTKITQKTQKSDNPQQQSMQKMMLYLFPVMFIIIGFSTPAGMSLYILVSVGVGLLQTIWLKKSELFGPKVK